MNLSEYLQIIFVWISSSVTGQYQLHSPIGSKLSSLQCPDQNITISCNFRGQNNAIGWYIDQHLQAQYVYQHGAQYPMNVPLEDNAVLKAKVQMLSASVSDMQFIFVNFTLTATFENLLPFQRSNITCGVFTVRSNVFQIQNFTTQVEDIRNISYLAKYQGPVGKLEEINIQWIDGFKLAMCTTITSYMVQLQGNEGLISTRELSTDNCTNSQCYVQFNSSDWNNSTVSESYEVVVTVNNQYYNNFTYSNTILNVTGNVIIFDTCNNTALITCSDLFNETCSVSSTAFTGPVIFMPGEENSLLPLVGKAPQDIKIIIQLNSTILEQTVSDNESCSNLTKVLAVVLPIVLVSFIVVVTILILVTIGVVVYKHKGNENEYKPERSNNMVDDNPTHQAWHRPGHHSQETLPQMEPPAMVPASVGIVLSTQPTSSITSSQLLPVSCPASGGNLVSEQLPSTMFPERHFTETVVGERGVLGGSYQDQDHSQNSVTGPFKGERRYGSSSTDFASSTRQF